MSNLVQYAEKELYLIGMGADSNEENKMMHDHIIHMVEEFSKEGHSGFFRSRKPKPNKPSPHSIKNWWRKRSQPKNLQMTLISVAGKRDIRMSATTEPS